MSERTIKELAEHVSSNAHQCGMCREAAAKLREQEERLKGWENDYAIEKMCLRDSHVHISKLEAEIERLKKELVAQNSYMATRETMMQEQLREKITLEPKRPQEPPSKLDEYIEYMAPAEHEYQPLHVAAFREIRDTLKELKADMDRVDVRGESMFEILKLQADRLRRLEGKE